MATTLYLTTRTAPYTPPTIRGAWDDTAGAVTRLLEPTRITALPNQDNSTTVARAETNAAANWDVLLYRGVSPALQAQTISGTLDVAIKVLESSVSADFAWHLHVFVTVGDTDVVRGTLLANAVETTANEWPINTAAGTALASPQALSSLAVSAGDRIVVEIGYVALNAVATSFTGTLTYGTTTASAVLPDQPLTTAAGAGLVRFSGAVAFAGTPQLRDTQALGETLVKATAPQRLTQAFLEVLRSPVIATASAVKHTQAFVETLVPAPPVAAQVRHTQGMTEALIKAPPVPTRTTQALLDTLHKDLNPALEATQTLLELLLQTPPDGGGGVPPAPGPPVVDPQTGKALRLFVELHGKQPVTTGAPVPRPVLSAETGLRDRATRYGGHKPARLVSIATIERELADELRAIEVRIVIADVDRFFRTYSTWGPLTGSYCAVYVVSDDVRYAEGVPYRLFAGIVTSHTAKPGFQYEFVVQDVFGQRFARLDESPRIPPFRLSLADFPGMDPGLDGKAAQVVLGEASDEFTGFLADRGPQGVVPPQRLGQVNFQTLWGGSDILVDAYIWSYGAVVTGGVWAVYYSASTPVPVTSCTQTGGVATATVPIGHGLIVGDTVTIADATPAGWNGTYTLTAVTSTTISFAVDASLGAATSGTMTGNRGVRVKVPDSAWGVDAWTPGKSGWAMTGLTTDYVDYAGHRYTPFFIRADHPLAKDVREGKILVAGNLYGLAEHGDGTPPYLDSAARLWQWLLVNQLFVPYYIGEYSPVPLLDDVVGPGYGCIDTDSVEAAHLAHHARVAGGYVVGFLLGSEGTQETMRHTLTELCSGADMEQGINRHGQAMLSVEPSIGSPDAEPMAHFTDIHDIEEGQFETWVESEEYYDRIEHQYGWRYVKPRAPSGTPKEGAALPETTVPKDQQEWTSGLVVVEHAAARAFNLDKPPRVKAVENRVVRSPAVAGSLEQTWLARAVGPEPMFEGPIYFRFTTGWQGLGVTTGIPIDLGSIIAMTHTEGYGQHGYIESVGQVRKITVDPQKARVTLEGRLLSASTPATGP